MRKHEPEKKSKGKLLKRKQKPQEVETTGKSKKIRGEKKDEMSINQSLLNIIAPIGMQIKHNELSIGENFAKVYGVVKYPQTKGYGWLGRLNNIPGTVAAIQFNPIDNSTFLETLNSSILQNRAKALSSKDPLAVKRATRMAEDGENIMTQIDQNGEVVGEMAMTIMPMANDREAFKKLCQKVESAFVMEKCKIRVLPYLQKEGFKSLSPAYSNDKEVDQVLKTIMPLSTFVGGFPFASSGYNDQKGYLFGKDSTGGLVIVDPWKRGNDRTNTNFVIMGDTGQGKSATIKHLCLMEYAMGTRIIFIDPEREYKYLCEQLGGDWINAGGDGKGRINPLQITPIPTDDEFSDDMYDEDSTSDMGAMALHLKTVDVFFNLYFKDITDVQRAILKDEVIQLYKAFGIDWDTDVTTMKNEDFPILKDLYDLIVRKEELFAEKNMLKERDMYNELGILLKDLALGSDSFLWSGHSTLSTNSQCVCLDTFDLNSSSDTIKCTQYFNLLNWAWQEMSRDRSERILLICDEAYLMIDDRVPQSLVFLRNAMKRARKYEAGIVIASHGVVDFLDPKIKLYGQALLDQPCFKIILGTGSQNLIETAKLYSLTEAETEVLGSKMRGRALTLIGADRLNIDFIIPDYKFKYFGTKGGR